MSSQNAVSGSRMDNKTVATTYLRAGSVLFALWGILHVYVGFMGLSLFNSANPGQAFFKIMK